MSISPFKYVSFFQILIYQPRYLQASHNKLEENYKEAHRERNELIERLKNYKLQEIEMFNQANERETEFVRFFGHSKTQYYRRNRQRLQSAIHDAIADLPPIDKGE